MKKIIVSILAAAAAVLCSACGDSAGGESKPSSSSAAQQSESKTENTLSVSARTEKLLSEVELPSMIELTAERLMPLLGVDEADLEEFSAYICPSGASPDEFGVFKAKSAESAANVKAALEKRADAQRKSYEDYRPDEMYKVDGKLLEISGNFVCYAICSDNAKAKSILM